MRRPIEVLVLALAACGSPEDADHLPPNADRRDEAFGASPPIRDATRSIALVVKRSKLPAAANGRISLVPVPLGERLGLCEGERFFDQPSATVGGATAFLIAPDKVATATHVIDDVGGVDELSVAFGYLTEAAVPDGDVYAAKSAVRGDGDFAVVTLDREVVGRAPLTLHRDGEVALEQRVVVVGHPLALPMKTAPGTVRVKQDGLIFFDTDTNQGNSGSPVLNADTGDVEGLFISGGEDFTTTADGCKKVIHRAPNDLTERAVPATVIASLLDR
jgi:S1-C subfamily serine protease